MMKMLSPMALSLLGPGLSKRVLYDLTSEQTVRPQDPAEELLFFFFFLFFFSFSFFLLLSFTPLPFYPLILFAPLLPF